MTFRIKSTQITDQVSVEMHVDKCGVYEVYVCETYDPPLARAYDRKTYGDKRVAQRRFNYLVARERREHAV